MSETAADKIKDGVDSAFGAGTADKTAGKVNELIGQGKQTLGDKLDNDKLVTDGAVQEAKGDLQQVGGTVQEKAEDVKEAVTGHPESLAEKIKEGFEHIVDRVKDALDGDDHTPKPTTPA